MFGNNAHDNEQIRGANSILDNFSKRQDAIKFVFYLVDNSQNPNTHFVAFKTMQDYIKKYWFVLPEEDRSFIKEKVVEYLKSYGENEIYHNKYKYVLTKLNTAFVEIVKLEYDKTWTSVITDICNFSMSGNLLLTENCILILKTMSEEIFDFGKKFMKQEALTNLKTKFVVEFQQVYNLCSKIIHEYHSNPSIFRVELIKSVLDTFTHFLTWIPIGYIFVDDTIALVVELVINPTLQIESICCLSEISNIKMDAEQLQKYGNTALQIFSSSIEKITGIIGDISFNIAYSNLRENDKQYFELFLKSFTSYIAGIHINWYCNFWTQGLDDYNMGIFNTSLAWLVQLIDFPENEVLKSTVEFAGAISQKFVAEYFSNYQNSTSQFSLNELKGNLVNVQSSYADALKTMMFSVVFRMVRPYEVRLSLDENGMVVWIEDDNTEQSDLHNLLASFIQHLSIMYYTDFKTYCINELKNQLNEQVWSKDKLFKLSWSIGCLSDILNEGDERGLVISTIRELLVLCEKKSGKDNKACVASNIMYVVGQYPRFLKNHYKFLKTVIRKLFEFLEEKHPGVQDMSSETLLKIFKKIKIEFLYNWNNQELFLDELCEKLNVIMTNIAMNNLLYIYEGIGQVLSQFSVEAAEELKTRNFNADHNTLSVIQGKQNSLINLYLTNWDSFISTSYQQIFSNPEQLYYENNYTTNLIQAYKVVGVFCLNVGSGFEYYFKKEYERVHNLLVLVSDQIKQGMNTDQAYKLKYQKSIKKQLCILITNFLTVCHENSINMIASNMVEDFNMLMNDYSTCAPEFKDPEVLNLFGVFIKRVGIDSNYLKDLMVKLIDSTLGFVTQDFENHPELRISMFTLMHEIILYRLDLIFQIGTDGFNFIFKCINWGINHHQPNIGEKVLNCAIVLLEKITSDKGLLCSFAENYLIRMTDMTFVVILDSSHKYGEKQHFQMLQQVFFIIRNYQLSFLVENNEKFNNKYFFIEHVINNIRSWFTNANDESLRLLLLKAVQACQDTKTFKAAIRDLILSTDQSASVNSNNAENLSEILNVIGNEWVDNRRVEEIQFGNNV